LLHHKPNFQLSRLTGLTFDYNNEIAARLMLLNDRKGIARLKQRPMKTYFQVYPVTEYYPPTQPGALSRVKSLDAIVREVNRLCADPAANREQLTALLEKASFILTGLAANKK